MSELRQKLPEWNGDADYLVRVLDEIERQDPHHASWIQAFKLYWGLIEGREPLSAHQIARRRSRSSNAIFKQCAAILKRLAEPKWWGDGYDP
jgi:hypothetical protein